MTRGPLHSRQWSFTAPRHQQPFIDINGQSARCRLPGVQEISLETIRGAAQAIMTVLAAEGPCSWKDKGVIIMGGGAGIGRAAALLFAEGGARVVMTGRPSEPMEFEFVVVQV
jgi:hypothetical protein